MFGHIAHHGVADGVGVVEGVGLIEYADPHATAHGDPSGIGFEPAGQHGQQAGFAVTVAADDADPVAFADADGDRVEHHPGGVFQMQGFAPEQVCHRRRPYLSGGA